MLDAKTKDERSGRHRDDSGTVDHAVPTDRRLWRGRDPASSLEILCRAQSEMIGRQAEALAHYRKIIDRSSAQAKIGIWECNLADQSLTWADGTYDLFDLPRGSPVTREQILPFYDTDSRTELETLRSKTVEAGSQFRLDTRIRTAKGHERWIRITANVECENGVPVRIFGMKQDITAEKALLDRLRYLAEYDTLTGLANRSLLQTHLNDPGELKPAGLLLLDLDGFKQVNDTFGHAAGDECLRQVAACLRRACGPQDILARMGGDEFAVVFSAKATREAIEACADRILEELRPPMLWDGQSFQVGGSIGIAFSHDRAVGGDLFAEADLALYSAKGDGRNRCCVFGARSRDASTTLSPSRPVGDVSVGDRLEFFYQPRLDMHAGRLMGFEVRPRWRDRRSAPPDDVDIANDPELVSRIGEAAIEIALTQAEHWRRAGSEFGRIAINLAAAQLHDAAFPDMLLGRLSSGGLSPDMVQLEIAEDLIVGDDTRIATALNRLKHCGVSIALGGFGAKIASLTCLRRVPFDVLKIDGAFVGAALQSKRDEAVLDAIFKLGRGLGLDVVADGIESIDHLACAKRLGCRYGQGNFLAAPQRASTWFPMKAASAHAA